MDYELIKSNYKSTDVKEQILLNRGFRPETIKHYLNTTDNDILDPATIANIKKGVVMLVNHISNQNKILIQVDSDCDGMTSSAVLINYLYYLYPAYT